MNNKSTKFGYTQNQAESVKNIKLPEIEAWENQYKRDYTIIIEELKSLKYYFLQYRNCGIFMENIANRILDDVIKAIKPKSCTVTGDFTPRGGLSSVIVAQYKAKK